MPRFPTHWSHGLQRSLKRRYKHPSPTSINGYHTAKKLLSQSPAKRPTFAFTGESGYTLGFRRRIAHSGLHAETGGVSDGGAISTLGPFCVGRRPCAAGWQNGVLCRFWALVGCAPEERRKPTGQRCAYARRCPVGVAAPLGCVIPLLFLSPHRWASRFCSAASLAHRKLSTCSLVTAVRFLNRCLRRSMRGTCPSEQRSGCQF